MQDLQKISSYLGFAARARKIVFGVDRICVLRRAGVVVMSGDVGENTAKQIRAFSEKTGTALVILEGNALEDILKKNNCKVVAVTDQSLAKAIIENA